jgi:hypothetical protein
MRIIVKRQVIFDFDMTPDVHLGMKSETAFFPLGQEHYMINKCATGRKKRCRRYGIYPRRITPKKSRGVNSPGFLLDSFFILPLLAGL